MKLLILILLNFSSFIFFGQNNSYEMYLKEQKVLNELRKISPESEKIEVQNAVSLCNSLQMKRNNFLKYRHLTRFNYYLNKESLVYENMGQAFLYGNVKSNFKNLLLLDSSKVNTIYNEYYGKYLERIDTNIMNTLQEVQSEDQKVRSEIYKIYSAKKEMLDSVIDILQIMDSTHISVYDSLIKENKGVWFSNEIRGDKLFYKKDFLLIYLPIINSNEKTVERFLDLILPECKKGNENWKMAERLMLNQMRRFARRKEFNYAKLRRIKFENDIVDFEDEKTILTAKSISILFSNMSQITIYPTELWKNDNYIESIYMLRELIIGFGIEPYRIEISNTKIPMDKKESVGDNYYFVFKKDF